MIRFPWGLWGDDWELLIEPRWPFWLSIAATLIPVLVTGALYRSQIHNLGIGWRTLLLGLRGLAVLVVAGLLVWRPALARSARDEEPGRILLACDLSGSMDVIDRGEKGSRKNKILNILKSTPLLPGLRAKHQMDIVGFQDCLLQNEPWEKLFDITAKKETGTNLSAGLSRGLETGDLTWRAVVLFSDGQHNTGPNPIAMARELGQRNVSIFAIPVGPKTPPVDLALLELRAPGQVLRGADVPIEAKVRITGVPKGKLIVELTGPGLAATPEHRHVIAHDGQDRIASIPFVVQLEKPGTQTLEVKIQPAKEEVNLANNQLKSAVRVAEDKAKVLLVDGEARWEHQYLGNALRRDEALAVDAVLFQQPRVGIVPEKDLEKIKNPRLSLPEMPKEKGEDPLWKYDCIVLGDVSPEMLSEGDRRRLERYVAESGGTLVVHAGKRFMPLEWLAKEGPNDPLVKLLPIREPKLLAPAEGFSLEITGEGQGTGFLNLESGPAENSLRWRELPKMFWGVVGKPQPGARAMVDAKLPKEPGQGVVVEQPFGFGRVLYIGIDGTWRWRYRLGDAVHHRVWGQIARWAASDRILPAGNEVVRFGPKAPIFRAGQEAEIAVRFSPEAGPLPMGVLPRARLVGKDSSIDIPLSPNERFPRQFEAKTRDLPVGEYRVEIEFPEMADKLKDVNGEADFMVLPGAEREWADLGVNRDLLQSLARESKGQVVEWDRIGELPTLLDQRVVYRTRHDEGRFASDLPWTWWTFGVVLGLLGLEWIARRMIGLK